MGFALDASEASEEIVQALTESLTIKKTGAPSAYIPPGWASWMLRRRLVYHIYGVINVTCLNTLHKIQSRKVCVYIH